MQVSAVTGDGVHVETAVPPEAAANARTTYPETALPTLLTGASQLTVAAVLPAVAVTHTGDVGAAAAMVPAFRYSRLVASLGNPLVYAAAAVLMALHTCAGVNVGFASRIRAAAPATCGVAIDVPLIVFVLDGFENHAEVMFTPGA